MPFRQIVTGTPVTSTSATSAEKRVFAYLVARLQENISRWLDSPAGWNRPPQDNEEQTAALDPILNAVFAALHKLAEERVAELHRADSRIRLRGHRLQLQAGR